MKTLCQFAIVLFAACLALPAADSALLNLTMPDAKVVAGMNIDQIKASPFGQFMLDTMEKNDEDLRKFIEVTGFDPRRDLREIVVSTNSTQGNKGKGLVVARGAFDASRIRTFLGQHGAVASNYMGAEIFTHSGKKGTEPSIALLGGGIAIAGDDASVRGALDRQRAGTRFAAPALTKINQLSAQNDFWVMSLVGFSEIAGRMPEPSVGQGAMQGEALQSITQAYGGVKFGTMVRISGEAVMRSDKDATALADVFRFLAGMVQLNRDKKETAEIAEALDSMNLVTEGNVMKFGIAIPHDRMERMFRPNGRRAPRNAEVI